MNITLFSTLLLGFGTVTTLVTEAIKKFLDGKSVDYDPQIVAVIAGIIIGFAGTLIYYAIAGITFTALNIVLALVEGLCVVVGSQVGYDKLLSVVKGFISNLGGKTTVIDVVGDAPIEIENKTE